MKLPHIEFFGMCELELKVVAESMDRLEKRGREQRLP